MLTVIENGYGYKPRTVYNCKNAGVTVALAVDFNTAGERLTARASGPRIMQISLNNFSKASAERLLEFYDRLGASTLHIAGNGVYTLSSRWRLSEAEAQAKADRMVFKLLRYMHKRTEIKLVYSGAQTGIDEAGVKAALRLGIKVKASLPIGYKYRGADGVDREASLEETIKRLSGKSKIIVNGVCCENFKNGRISTLV